MSKLEERLLVATAAMLGVAAIAAQAMEPFAVSYTALIGNVPAAISLDAGTWTPARDRAHGFDYALPPGWTSLEDGRDRIVVAQNATGGLGSTMSIEIRPTGESVEALASREFADLRPVLYDIAVDSRPALFAASFKGRRVGQQAAYIPLEDGRVMVIRGDGVDPAVFSIFVSSIKFFTL